MQRRRASSRPDAGTGSRATGSRGTHDRGVPDAGQRSAPVRVPTATVGTLLIYSKGFGKTKVDLFNDAYLSSSAALRQVDSWQEIAKAIGEYKSIDKLVFLVHSNPGTFLFGPDAAGRTFSSGKALADAAKELTSLSVKPEIRSVDVAGCNVGLDADSVVQFGLALGAAEIVATNHFHEFALVTLESRPGQSATIERNLRSLRGYVATRGTDALVEQARTSKVSQTILLEWYVAFADEHEQTLPVGPNVNSDARAKVFKRPSDAFTVGVAGQADLDAVKQDFAQFGGQEPIRRLIRVNIKLDGFRAAPDAGRPAPRPATGSRDAGRRASLDSDASTRPSTPFPGRRPGEIRLEARDQAIVDEVFRRGGSVSDAMGVLFMRALDRTDLGVPPVAAGPPGAARASAPAPGRRESRPRFTLEDRGLLRDQELSELQQRRSDEVELLRPLVAARFDDDAAAVKREFAALSPDVATSFAPITEAPYIDPFATAEEKYRGMRGAYYRAGWTCVRRDVLNHIVPTTFFGATVVGGTHRELSAVLAQVEDEIRRDYPDLASQQKAAGFSIGGFVPRFQAGSDALSNHAFGLAIDIDATWNPQLKSAAARKAFARATGDDVGQSLSTASSIDAVRRLYIRIERMSARLKAWLNEWMPKYQQLQEERATARRDPNGKQKLAAIDRELAANPDLAALVALIGEYKLATVQSWRAYGIVTIPPEIIAAFKKAGQKNGARWGGQYEQTKDIMHLELLYLADPRSLAKPGGPGRRRPMAGFDDLVRGEPPPAPDCRDPRPGPEVPPPQRVPVAPLR
jgi:hypothetical protein